MFQMRGAVCFVCAEMHVVYVQSESKHQPELIWESKEQVHTCCPFECTVLGAETG